MRTYGLFLAGLFILGAMGHAIAVGTNFGHIFNAVDCSDVRLTVDERIAACHRVLLSHLLNRSETAVTYLNLGVAYTEKGDNDSAIDAYTKSIEANPDLKLNYFDRGIIYWSLGRNDLALADLDEAVSRAPDDTEFLLKRGEIQRSLGHLDLALKDFDRAVSLKPGDPAALEAQCRARAALGQGKESDCKDTSTDAQRVDRLNRHGIMTYSAGDYRAATAIFEQALAIDPKSAVAIYMRGRCEEKLGDTKSANKDFRAAQDIDFHVIDAVEQLTGR